MVPDADINIHAGCIVLGNKGVLVCGASNTGKSSLALKLIAQSRTNGEYAALVSDDQTLLSCRNGRLIARCPLAIGGKVEVRGHGIVEVPFLASSIVHLVVELVDLKQIERMPDNRSTTISGVNLPLVQLPVRRSEQALPVVFAALAGLNR